MADINSGLPIRSEADGTDERVHVKVVDGATPAQRMTVDTDLNAHVEIHGDDPAAVDRVVRLSEQGAITPDGFYDAALNTKPGNVGLIAFQRAVTPGDADQVEKLTAITSNDVHALDVALHDEDGNAFSASNPLPVTFVDSEGTEVNNYNTGAALAAGATSNHDYTVTAATTLKLSQIWASASGKMRIEVSIETAPASGVFVSRFVGFNSTSQPNIRIPVNENIEVAAGVKVRVARKNNDNQAQDVYSTISGHEIA